MPIDEDALAELQAYSWGRNIRELRNVIERLLILSGDRITKDDVLNFAIPSV
jgi:DNA-binding NtrC family response regulator